jgi:hypothetical protein
MLNTRSFSDILIDQILEDYDLKQNPVASPPLNAGWESTAGRDLAFFGAELCQSL